MKRENGGWYVGQPVLVCSLNSRGRGPDNGEIVKVGTKLIHVKSKYGTLTYRIGGGTRNDAYGHEWVMSLEGYADSQRHEALVDELRPQLDRWWNLPLDVLEGIKEVLAARGEDGER